MLVVRAGLGKGPQGSGKKEDYFFYPAYLLSLGGGGEGCALGEEDGSELGRNLEPEDCSSAAELLVGERWGRWSSGFQR